MHREKCAQQDIAPFHGAYSIYDSIITVLLSQNRAFYPTHLEILATICNFASSKHTR